MEVIGSYTSSLKHSELHILHRIQSLIELDERKDELTRWLEETEVLRPMIAGTGE